MDSDAAAVEAGLLEQDADALASRTQELADSLHDAHAQIRSLLQALENERAARRSVEGDACEQQREIARLREQRARLESRLETESLQQERLATESKLAYTRSILESNLVWRGNARKRSRPVARAAHVEALCAQLRQEQASIRTAASVAIATAAESARSAVREAAALAAHWKSRAERAEAQSLRTLASLLEESQSSTRRLKQRQSVVQARRQRLHTIRGMLSAPRQRE